MTNFQEYEKFDCYLGIDLIIANNKENEKNKVLFKLKNKNIVVGDNTIDQSIVHRIIQKKLR